MNEQRRVETVEEFKLRIAAIIGGQPEQITGAPRPHPLLVRRKKGATHRKQNVERLDRLMHVYEVRPRKDKRGIDLISDVLPFGWLWFSRQLHTIKNRTMG
jgi:hypothetical protein